jgi:hypothetical protein
VQIRDATAADWPAIWPFLHEIVAAGDTFGEEMIAWGRREGYRGIKFNAVAASNTPAVAMYESLGFEILATIPEGFRHPTQGYVGLHTMYLRL